MRLRQFIIRRIIQTIITLIVILILLFVIFRMMPSDPVSMIIDPRMGPDAKHQLAVRYGFEGDRWLHSKTTATVMHNTTSEIKITLETDIVRTELYINATADFRAVKRVWITYHGMVVSTEWEADKTAQTISITGKNEPGEYIIHIYGLAKNNVSGNVFIERSSLQAYKVSMLTQFGIYMKNMLTFDLGNSFNTGRPVIDEIRERAPATLLLFGTATILAYLVGIGIGVIMAWRRGSKGELAGIVISLFFYAMPLFWFGLILIWAFAFTLGWFPLGQMKTPDTNYQGLDYVRDLLWHLTLPLVTLMITHLAGDALLMRNSMLEVMGEDYITTARAKGLGENRVMYKHAARNAMLPVVTAMALAMGGVIGGGVLTETIFSWPGMGRYLISSTLSYDYPAVQGTFFILAILTVVANICADMLYAYLDPRVRL